MTSTSPANFEGQMTWATMTTITTLTGGRSVYIKILYNENGITTLCFDGKGGVEQHFENNKWKFLEQEILRIRQVENNSDQCELFHFFLE